MLPVAQITFRTRLERVQFIATRLGRFIHGRVLDVGCDQAHLRRLLNLQDYVGIDVAGQPDLRLDLETIDRLPFSDGSFDTVLCCEVLEHLDNLHFLFGELVRVTRRHLIVSLPNNWCNARRPIARGRGDIGHYGLPLDPPTDRHKWFFGLGEARAFVDGQAGRHGLRLVESFATEKPRPFLLSLLRRMRYWNATAYLNRYAHTYWAVLEKPASALSG